MKKTLSIVLLALASAVLLSAQTLKFGDNIPDRSNGYGAVIEQINAEFKAANPGVELTTESYPDQPYQQKIKIYSAARQLPDVFKWWAFPNQMKPLIDGKYLLPLNINDFKGNGYMAGALEGNVYGGKLYGIPVSADFWVIYYNKKLFKDAGITKIPTTLDELLATIPKFKAKNIIPAVTDGKDAWPLNITYDLLAGRVSGDFTLTQQALDRKIKFTHPAFLEAAKLMVKMVKAGFFQEDLMVSDYGASRNLFGQGRAAMYIMGTWELGLATDQNFSQEFRDNVDAFKFPTVAGGKGKIDDLFAWFGGNYVVNATSKNVALGQKYLQFYSKRFPALAWEKQAALPAQTVKAGPNDTTVAKTILSIAADATKTSGPVSSELSTAAFKEDVLNLTRELCVGIITPEEFVAKLDAAAEKASKVRS